MLLRTFFHPPRQGAVPRRDASITCNSRSASRRTAKAFIPSRSNRSRALGAYATSAQSSTRAGGVRAKTGLGRRTRKAALRR